MLLLGLYWGAIPTLHSGASKEENKYRQGGIEDRSCWTGEPAKTGSPASDLQLSEGHLAGILDDIL